VVHGYFAEGAPLSNVVIEQANNGCKRIRHRAGKVWQRSTSSEHDISKYERVAEVVLLGVFLFVLVGANIDIAVLSSTALIVTLTLILVAVITIAMDSRIFVFAREEPAQSAESKVTRALGGDIDGSAMTWAIQVGTGHEIESDDVVKIRPLGQL
jgi:hypothetical protein